MNTPRVGLYAWAGPGTIRLIKTKYHSPKLDDTSFMALYDLPFLKRAKELFSVTDMWVTYSWGFSDQTEEEDYQFLRTKLPNFKQLGIKTHAYVQGFNVVTDEFKDQDIFCQDPNGQQIPYSKSRSFTCPSNPKAVAIILDRVRKAVAEDVDGVFIDNIIVGLPPFYVRSDFISFFGCACKFCQTEFKTRYGYTLPLSEKSGGEIRDYIDFRTSLVTAVIQKAATICQEAKKEFGVNLYDALWYKPEIHFGYCLAEIEPHLSYLLIENHSLPSQTDRNNSYLLPIIQSVKKPVFIVSYIQGIGSESSFKQTDINAIFSESKQLGYCACLKATEFTTNGVWHTLDLSLYTEPQTVQLCSVIHPQPKQLKKSSLLGRMLVRAIQPLYVPSLQSLYNQRYLNFAFTHGNWYQKQLKAFRNFEIRSFHNGRLD